MRADDLLGIYLREPGVFMQRGTFPAQVTIAHRQADLDAIVRSYATALDNMVTDGVIAAA